MSIKYWCQRCSASTTKCQSQNEHKKETAWRVDFMLGGRDGQRLRKVFPTKDLAVAYESQMRTDYLRGHLLPSEMQAKIPFRQLANEWYTKHACVMLKNPKAESYHLNVITNYFGNKGIASLKHKDGEDFRECLIRQGKRKGAVNRDIHTLKSVLNWAVKNGYLLTNPFQHLKLIKEDNQRTRWLLQEEATHLLETAAKLDPSLVDVILFGLLTGFRKQNICSVTAQDIHGEYLRAQKTKSGKPYDVLIGSELRSLLNRLIQHSGPLLNTADLDHRFRAVVKASGMWSGARSDQTVTIHTLRHTFASWYMQNGGDIYTLQKRMGHESLRMTERYAHLGKQIDEREMQAITFNITPKIELKIA